MKIAQLFVELLICSALAACGGSSSGSSIGGALNISPASASVAAGSTQLYTVTNGNGDTITWQVNGTTGGNASVGTISTGGLYTAPAIPPTSQPVSITAMQDSNTGSAAATVTYSNASLNGQFVFTFSELRAGISTNVVGLITADGSGNISGTEDVNGPAILPPSAVTGNYTLSANGQGTLTLNGGVTLNLTLTLIVGASQGVLTDATMGRVGGGSLFPMTGVVNSASNLGGNYTIDLGANNATTNDNSVGLLTLSAPNINGSTDENNNGAVTTFNPVSGNYAMGSGNRGTLSLTVAATTNNYVFYAVSPNQLELMCTDPGCINTGELNSQTSQTVAAGNYVFSLMGSGTGSSPDALLINGSMNPTSSTGGTASNLTIYENSNGFYQAIIGATTYTVSSSGRGQITIQSPSGSRDFVFYVQSAGYLYMLETTLAVTGNTSGFAVAKQGNASAASGQYLLFTLGQTPSLSALSTTQATLHVASSGQVTGQEVLNNNGAISTLSVSGTLMASQTAGIYTTTLNLGGGQTASYVMAAVAPGVLLPIRTDSTEVSVGGMFIQYTSP